MTIRLPALAAAFAAFCIWLTVRIVNRRERWAIWSFTAMLVAAALYIASFPLAFQIWKNDWISADTFIVLYNPAAWFVKNCPASIQSAVFWVWTHTGITDVELFFLLHE